MLAAQSSIQSANSFKFLEENISALANHMVFIYEQTFIIRVKIYFRGLLFECVLI